MQQVGYFMTFDEEMAARGRMITEYTNTKQHRATLYAEAIRLADTLTSLATTIKFGPKTGSVRVLTVEEKAALDCERMQKFFEDFNQTEEKLRNLRTQLKELGLISDESTPTNNAII